MHNLFPEMYEKPENQVTIALGAYWIAVFVIFPVAVQFLLLGLLYRLDSVSWCAILFYLVCALGLLPIVWEHLKYSLRRVGMRKKDFFTTVAIAAGLILVCGFLPMNQAGYLSFPVAQALPITFGSVLISPAALVVHMPLWGTLCMVLLVPVTTCCLFYPLGFASVCANHPKLAYVVVALVAAIPQILGFMLVDNFGDPLASILFSTPVHLISCWSYQRTDNLLAPIAVHTAVNLAICLILAVMGATGQLYVY